jgi:hypothetical protein
MLFDNSMGHNRRHYEPDRPHTVIVYGQKTAIVTETSTFRKGAVDREMRPPAMSYGTAAEGSTVTPVGGFFSAIVFFV